MEVDTFVERLPVRVAEILALPARPKRLSEKPILKLTLQHRRILALYLQGCTRKEIASVLGCSYGKVVATIRNSASQELIKMALTEADEDLKALVPLTVKAIRDSLVHPQASVQLKAVDALNKTLGRYDRVVDDSESAEDVARRLIHIRHGDLEIDIAEEALR